MLSSIRDRACGSVMSNGPLICSSLDTLTRRYIMQSHWEQMPIRVPKVSVRGLIFSHVAGRRSRRATAHAVDFAGRTRLTVLQPPCLKKRGKLRAENQHRPPVVTGWQAPFDPFAHGVAMNMEETGDLFHRVGAVSLDEPMIGVSHGLRGVELTGPRYRPLYAVWRSVSRVTTKARISSSDLPANPRRVEGRDFAGGPTHGARTKAHKAWATALG